MVHNFFMNRLKFSFLLLISGSIAVHAQSVNRSALADAPAILGFAATDSSMSAAPVALPNFAPVVSLPRMSPELTLSAFQQRAARQGRDLRGYSAATLIRAELPDNAQQGQLELERSYVAPHTLRFKSVRFQGDNFVKSNVIARLLQSEVDHVQKDDPTATALCAENYKFSYKGVAQTGERTLHVFQVKPRKKRVGLFKGHIFLDAATGSLVRAEGRIVKSPSLFVKKIDFVQDYEDIDGFTLPSHIHSEAKAALVGKTIVDITNRDYHPQAATENAAVAGSR